MLCEIGRCSFGRVNLKVALLDCGSLLWKFSDSLVLAPMLITAPVICMDASIVHFSYMYVLTVKVL